MFGSTTLEIAIGLAFVYLLFSLVCTSLTEGIARVLRLRASTLQSAIANMIVGEKGEQGNVGIVHNFYENTLIKSLAKSSGYDTLLAYLGKLRKWINCKFSWLYIILGGLLFVLERFAPSSPWLVIVIGVLLVLNGIRLFWTVPIYQWIYEKNETLGGLIYAKIPALYTLLGLLLVILGLNASPPAWGVFLVGLFLLLLGLPEYSSGRPSYIPKHIFAPALLDVLVKKDVRTTLLNFNALKTAVESKSALSNLPIKSTLEIFLAQATENKEENLPFVQSRVEEWFKDVMERVNGWYTRKARVVVVILAFLLTVTMNIDTMAIAGALSRNVTLRNSVVNAANSFLVANPTLPSVAPAGSPANGGIDASQPMTLTLDQLEGEIDSLGIPIGWVTNQKTTNFELLTTLFVTRLVITPTMSITMSNELSRQYAQARKDRRTWPTNGEAWGKKIAGFLLTIIALSLGAPFWFDRLKHLMNLRSTGKPPQETKNQ